MLEQTATIIVLCQLEAIICVKIYKFIIKCYDVRMRVHIKPGLKILSRRYLAANEVHLKVLVKNYKAALRQNSLHLNTVKVMHLTYDKFLLMESLIDFKYGFPIESYSLKIFWRFWHNRLYCFSSASECAIRNCTLCILLKESIVH